MFRLSVYLPRMFHRRVLLLFLMGLFAFLGLVVRLGWMTYGENGSKAREKAASYLVMETWIPSVRGRIYDRKGRVLAGDSASYDIGIDYRILAGQWVYETRSGNRFGIEIDRYARRLAQRATGESWELLDEEQKSSISDEFEGAMRQRVTQMYQIISVQTGISMEELFARRDEIVGRVSRSKASYTRRTRERLLAKYDERGDEPSEADLDRIEEMSQLPIAEETIVHAIVSNVSDDLGFSFIRMQGVESELVSQVHDEAFGGDGSTSVLEANYPGLKVIDASSREYPYRQIEIAIDRSWFPKPLKSDQIERVLVDDVGTMILGDVRVGVQQEDAQRRARAIESDDELRARSVTQSGIDRGKYFTEDKVGRSGIERTFEDHLRGLRGHNVFNRQTGESVEMALSPGLDMQITIDIMLQARIRALLDPRLGLARVQSWHLNEDETMPVGTELDAGVVVLEIASGEILAMISTPVPPSDGDWSRYGVRSESDARLYKQIHQPYVNRAIAKPYPPGSVAKALILTGAAKYGKYSPGETIEATGFLIKGQPNRYRSWIWKIHGQTHFEQLERHPNGVDALMVSSNVFFFTLGRKLGPDEISDLYRLYRVEIPYGLGIGQEWAGSLAPFSGERLNIEHATLMGIGQGPVTWTPLHAADSYSTIARNGYRMKPKLVVDGRAPSVTDIGIPSWSVREVLDGLKEVVSNREYGSGFGIRYGDDLRHTPTFDAPGIDIWGKTGTAEAPAITFDPDLIGNENGPLDPIVVRDGDHSWYVTLVGREGGNPEYAIAVIVEYAGSGGRVSGPINNQIVHALIDEGYLPDYRSDVEWGESQ